MSPADLERYLYEHIPLSRAMGVEVLEASAARVRLSAPLAPNLNHRNTVFGGSESAVAILACWSWLHLRAGRYRLVIRRNSMDYLAPIEGGFEAVCEAPSEEAWGRFRETLDRRGKARIALSADVFFGEILAGRLEGEFVAVNVDPK